MDDYYAAAQENIISEKDIKLAKQAEIIAKQAEQLKEANHELRSWNDNFHKVFNVGKLTTTTDDYFAKYKARE